MVRAVACGSVWTAVADEHRWWQMIAKYQTTILYTAATTIRTFMKWGEQIPGAHDLSPFCLNFCSCRSFRAPAEGSQLGPPWRGAVVFRLAVTTIRLPSSVFRSDKATTVSSPLSR